MSNHDRLMRLFLEADEINDPEERAAFLDRVCQGDPSLRESLESLLAEETDADLLGQGGINAHVLHGDLPESIGRFKPLRRIGVGGMGVVYEAEQDNPRRRVAIKVMRPDRISEMLLRRFVLEADVMAELKHPGIAQILEAGTATGILGAPPYFAMELVQGRPLLDYAEEEHLSHHQRLKLFAETCEAVQHAHQRGVIHRDLKSENILVDETGQPKILDFGIARCTSAERHPVAPQTHSRQVLGTIPYMSPEQAAGSTSDIDVRTDVYALGVLLYELLSGHPPYSLAGLTTLQALAAIQSQQPQPLGEHSRDLRGDLQVIAGKALEKDKERRYASVSDLARDLQRHQRDEPIYAQAPSTWYRTRKFVKRNKVLVAAFTAVLVSVLAGAAAERRQRLFAEDSQAQAQLMTDLYEDMWTSPDPFLDFSHDVTVREVLDYKAESALERLAPYPSLQADFSSTLARTYHGLGVYDKAEALAREAINGYESLGIEKGRKALSAQGILALSHHARGRHSEAHEAFRYLWRTSEQLFGSDDLDTLSSAHNVAIVLHAQGRYGDAEGVFRKVLSARRREIGDDHPTTLETLGSLATSLTAQGRNSEALQIHQDVWRVERESLGIDHPSTLTSQTNIAMILRLQGKYDEALKALREIRVLWERRFGDRYPRTLITRNEIALVLQDLGRYEEARQLHRENMIFWKETQGDEHPDYLACQHNLAGLLEVTGEHSKALETIQPVIRVRKRVLSEDHPHTLSSSDLEGRILNSLGRFEEALNVFQTVAEGRTQRLGSTHSKTLSTLHALGATLHDLGRNAEAADVLQGVVDNQSEGADKSADRFHARNDLANVLYTLGRKTESLRHLREVVDAQTKEIGESHHQTARSRNDLSTVRKELDAEFRRELQRQRGASSPEELIRSVHRLGWFLFENRKYLDGAGLDESYDLLAEAFELARATLAEDSEQRGKISVHYGFCRMEFGEFAEALELLRQGAHILEDTLGPGHMESQDVARGLAICYQELGLDESSSSHDAPQQSSEAVAE